MSKSKKKDPGLNVADIDFSVIRTAIETGGKMVDQILNGVHYGSPEIRMLLREECDMILECRVCRALFRSLPNFVAHKRVYCPQGFNDFCRDHYRFPNPAFPVAKDPPVIIVEPTAPREAALLDKDGQNTRKKMSAEDTRQKSHTQPAPAGRKLRSKSNSSETSDHGRGTSNSDGGRRTRDRTRSVNRSNADTVSSSNNSSADVSKSKQSSSNQSTVKVQDCTSFSSSVANKTMTRQSDSGSASSSADSLGALADTVRQIEEGALGNSPAYHLYSAAAEKMARENAQEKSAGVCSAPIVSNSNALFVSTSDKGLEEILDVVSHTSPDIPTLAENGQLVGSKPRAAGPQGKGKSNSDLLASDLKKPGSVSISPGVALARSSVRNVSNVVRELRRNKEENDQKALSQTLSFSSAASTVSAANITASRVPSSPGTVFTKTSNSAELASGTSAKTTAFKPAEQRSAGVDSVCNPAGKNPGTYVPTRTKEGVLGQNITSKSAELASGASVLKTAPKPADFVPGSAVVKRMKVSEGKPLTDHPDSQSTSSSPKEENIPPTKPRSGEMSTLAVVKRCLTGCLGAVRSSPLKLTMDEEGDGGVEEESDMEEEDSDMEEDSDIEEDDEEEGLTENKAPYESAIDMENTRCRVCKMNFTQRRTLVYHCRARHSGQRTIFPCPYCPRVFYYLWGLTRHLNNNHKKSHSEIDRMRKRLRQKAYKQDFQEDKQVPSTSENAMDSAKESVVSKAKPSIPAWKLLSRLSGSSSEGSPPEASVSSSKDVNTTGVRPVSGPTKKQTLAPSTKPVPTTSNKPALTPSNKPVPTPSNKPASTASNKPVPTPSNKPASTASNKPVPTPSNKAVSTSSNKPVSTPSNKPTSAPVDKSASCVPSESGVISPAVTRSAGSSRIVVAAASSVKTATFNIYRKTYPNQTRSGRLLTKSISPQRAGSSPSPSPTLLEGRQRRFTANPRYSASNFDADDQTKKSPKSSLENVSDAVNKSSATGMLQSPKDTLLMSEKGSGQYDVVLQAKDRAARMIRNKKGHFVALAKQETKKNTPVNEQPVPQSKYSSSRLETLLRSSDGKKSSEGSNRETATDSGDGNPRLAVPGQKGSEGHGDAGVSGSRVNPLVPAATGINTGVCMLKGINVNKPAYTTSKEGMLESADSSMAEKTERSVHLSVTTDWLSDKGVNDKSTEETMNRPPSRSSRSGHLTFSSVISDQFAQLAPSGDGKTNPLHICPHCERAFSRKISLDSHVQICSKAPAKPTQLVQKSAAAAVSKPDTKTVVRKSPSPQTRGAGEKMQSPAQQVINPLVPTANATGGSMHRVVNKPDIQTHTGAPGSSVVSKSPIMGVRTSGEMDLAQGKGFVSQTVMATRLRSKEPSEATPTPSSMDKAWSTNREQSLPGQSPSAGSMSRPSRSSVSPALSHRSSSRDSSVSSKGRDLSITSPVNATTGTVDKNVNTRCRLRKDSEEQQSKREQDGSQLRKGSSDSSGRLSRADRASRRDQMKATPSSRESSLESVGWSQSADVEVQLALDQASRASQPQSVSRSSRAGSVSESSRAGSVSRSARADASSRASCSSRDSSVESHSRTGIRDRTRAELTKTQSKDHAVISTRERKDSISDNVSVIKTADRPSPRQQVKVPSNTNLPVNRGSVSPAFAATSEGGQHLGTSQGKRSIVSSQRPKRKRRAPCKISDGSQDEEGEDDQEMAKNPRLDSFEDDCTTKDSVTEDIFIETHFPIPSEDGPLEATDGTVQESLNDNSEDEDDKTVRLVEEIWMDKKPGRPSERVRSNRIYVIEPARAGRLTCQDTRKVGQIVDEGGLECRQCQQRFTSVSNLRRHAIRHLGWRRFKCRLCRFCSYNRSECNTHILRAHPERLRASGSGGPRIDSFITDLNRQAASVRSTKKRQTLDSRRTDDVRPNNIYLQPKSCRQAAKAASMKQTNMEKSSAGVDHSPKETISATNTKPTTPPRPTVRRRKSATPTSREESRRTRLNMQRFNISTRNSPRKFDTRPYQADSMETLCTRKGFYSKAVPSASMAKSPIPTSLSQRLESFEGSAFRDTERRVRNVKGSTSSESDGNTSRDSGKGAKRRSDDIEDNVNPLVHAATGTLNSSGGRIHKEVNDILGSASSDMEESDSNHVNSNASEAAQVMSALNPDATAQAQERAESESLPENVLATNSHVSLFMDEEFEINTDTSGSFPVHSEEEVMMIVGMDMDPNSNENSFLAFFGKEETLVSSSDVGHVSTVTGDSLLTALQRASESDVDG